MRDVLNQLKDGHLHQEVPAIFLRAAYDNEALIKVF
jgi:hypothetical protein